MPYTGPTVTSGEALIKIKLLEADKLVLTTKQSDISRKLNQIILELIEYRSIVDIEKKDPVLSYHSIVRYYQRKYGEDSSSKIDFGPVEDNQETIKKYIACYEEKYGETKEQVISLLLTDDVIEQINIIQSGKIPSGKFYLIVEDKVVVTILTKEMVKTNKEVGQND